MPLRAYLERTMLARLLACLALVTGLAAVGAPAQARMVAEVSEQMQADNGAQPACHIAFASLEQLSSEWVSRTQTGCAARKPFVIFIPTVQFGPDRAFE